MLSSGAAFENTGHCKTREESGRAEICEEQASQREADDEEQIAHTGTACKATENQTFSKDNESGTGLKKYLTATGAYVTFAFAKRLPIVADSVTVPKPGGAQTRRVCNGAYRRDAGSPRPPIESKARASGISLEAYAAIGGANTTPPMTRVNCEMGLNPVPEIARMDPPEGSGPSAGIIEEGTPGIHTVVTDEMLGAG
jgi:hypothetical protein